VLRIYDTKSAMPRPILDLFQPNTAGVTEWSRYCAVCAEDKSEDELADTISHELVHAYLGSLMGSEAGMLPQWFHEGAAMYLSCASRTPSRPCPGPSSISFSRIPPE